MTQNILNALLNGQPLTHIEDVDGIWEKCTMPDGRPETYQCKRMSSLFKEIYANGTVKYNDVERVCCANIHNPNETFYFGLVRMIVNEMFPITMPYVPDKSIKVYCEEFLTDKKNGDFDTVGIFYALKTESGNQKKIEINRFFREPENDENGVWVEICKKEYYERKEAAIDRI